MKISAARPNKKKRPFIDTPELTISVKHEKNKIIGFDVRWGNQVKHFAVKKHNITAAWQEVEKFTAKL